MIDLPVGRPAIMGILNVTPDSFSDGGSFYGPDQAVARAVQMMEAGADLIDVGGESTRPGAEPVTTEEELARILPVVRKMAALEIPISIDTMKSEVARAAIDEGAELVNDVSGLGDPLMVGLIASTEVGVCVMHMQGTPMTMQLNPHYEDVVVEVQKFLLMRVQELLAKGVPPNRIWIDPGIGFGKSLEHNLSLLQCIPTLVATGFPVLIGVSRKGFLGRVLGGQSLSPIEDRLPAALAAQVLAQASGVKIIRTHDVAESRNAAVMTAALLAE